MGNSASRPWPAIIYGTAWKKDATAGLTQLAIEAGYRAIDTANQPLHYNEPGVGEGVKGAMRDLGLEREEVFLQTKFTPLDSQGERVPYDPRATLGGQVEESLQGSLDHLGTNYLDSYLLHGPHDPFQLTEDDWAVWSVLEEFKRRGDVRCIGVSNVGVNHLRALLEGAAIPPEVVQNRCFARRGWDREVRGLCAEHGIAYQGFSLLTANAFVLEDNRITELASQYGLTPAQVVFVFARQAGMIPLTGTTDRGHMADDLASLDYELGEETWRMIEQLAG